MSATKDTHEESSETQLGSILQFYMDLPGCSKLLQVKHIKIRTLSFHAHPLFQASLGSQACNSYVCSSLLSLSIMTNRKQMWKNNAKLLTVWATPAQQWDYWAVLKSFCSNQPSVKIWTMRLMNCNIITERRCQSQLFVLHRYRKKVFQTVYEVTEPKKTPTKAISHW